jgi:putative endonuclease
VSADRPFSLYILRCADGTLYTGIAADVARRIAEHSHGPRGARFLRGKGPLELVFEEAAGSRAEASRLEHRVKRLSRAAKLELISGKRRLQDLLRDQVLEGGGA